MTVVKSLGQHHLPWPVWLLPPVASLSQYSFECLPRPSPRRWNPYIAARVCTRAGIGCKGRSIRLSCLPKPVRLHLLWHRLFHGLLQRSSPAEVRQRHVIRQWELLWRPNHRLDPAIKKRKTEKNVFNICKYYHKYRS